MPLRYNHVKAGDVRLYSPGFPTRVLLGNLQLYTRIPLRYRGVGKWACSTNYREEFFSETRRTEGSNLPHTISNLEGGPEPSARHHGSATGLLMHFLSTSDLRRPAPTSCEPYVRTLLYS